MSQGRDCVVQAQSGTGKTGAFAIGTLARVDASLREPQILVLEPVRELARQTAGVYRELSTRMGVYVACITGGTSFQTNRKLLRSSQVVVCTPGRLIDCLRRGWMRLDRVRMLVLDEADEMLSHGFVDDMRDIVRDVSNSVPLQTIVAYYRCFCCFHQIGSTRLSNWRVQCHFSTRVARLVLEIRAQSSALVAAERDVDVGRYFAILCCCW